jgi:hypothetical protein
MIWDLASTYFEIFLKVMNGFGFVQIRRFCHLLIFTIYRNFSISELSNFKWKTDQTTKANINKDSIQE